MSWAFSACSVASMALREVAPRRKLQAFILIPLCGADYDPALTIIMDIVKSSNHPRSASMECFTT